MMYKITPLPHQLKQTVAENAQLNRYLESLQREVPFTRRSWLYEHEDTDHVLNEWMSRLTHLKRGSAFEQEVFQFDTSQLEKWGPQGGHEPISQLMDSVVLPTFEKSSETTFDAFRSAHWKLAKQTVTRRLTTVGQANRLRPASYAHVVDDMRVRDTLNSNSGYPDFRRRNIPEVEERAIEDARSGRWKTYPAIALFRRYNGKTRLVWMFPMSANLVEGSFFQPLQSALMKSELAKEFLAPWRGFEQVRDLVTENYSQGMFLAASDFSATDAHFTYQASRQVFDVIAPCFQEQYRDSLWDSISHMHVIPLLIGPDRLLVGDHGVSSGSNWTNFIETIFDMILAQYVEIESGMNVHGLYAIGDDMAWWSRRYNPAFALRLEAIAKACGMVVKAEKTTNERDKVKSLQRLFQRGYSREDGKLRAVYPTIRALKSSLFPERFHNPKVWNSNMFCARQFMILENCVDHPLFHEFVAFVCKGQRDLFRFAHLSKRRLQDITRESKLIPGLNPTYNQERRDTSLATFESIRYAASIS